MGAAGQVPGCEPRCRRVLALRTTRVLLLPRSHQRGAEPRSGVRGSLVTAWIWTKPGVREWSRHRYSDKAQGLARSVSTGSSCLSRLARVPDPPPNEARSAGGDLGGPAVSVSPAGASGGPAGAGSRCSADAANLRRSFPTAQLGLEP
ncbi:hypothetical protein NN561_018318 [Cricetulus griseus]